MATHALGAGTCNLSVNVRLSVHRTVGRMAFLRNVSVGAFVRSVLANIGVVATEVRQNRRNAAEIRRIIADGKVTPDELPALNALASREEISAAKLEKLA